MFGGIEEVYSIPVNGSTPTLVAGPIGSPPYVAASPSIDAVFVASQWIMEYDTRAGTPIRDEVHEGPFAYAAAFDPAGERVAIGGDFGLVIRGAPNGAVLATPDFRQSSPIYEGLDFSPDGSHFVTGTGDGLIHLWTTADWQSHTEIDTATRGVHSTFFSPERFAIHRRRVRRRERCLRRHDRNPAPNSVVPKSGQPQGSLLQRWSAHGRRQRRAATSRSCA